MKKIYIGGGLLEDILQGRFGEAAKARVDAEIKKRMPETNDLGQKIQVFVELSKDTKLLESIISQARGDQ